VGTAEITALPGACASKCLGHADGVSETEIAHGPGARTRETLSADACGRREVHRLWTGRRSSPRGQTAGPRRWQKTALHSASLDGSSPLLWDMGGAHEAKYGTLAGGARTVDTWAPSKRVPRISQGGSSRRSRPAGELRARLASDGNVASSE
jgi:hypothetical protein